MRSHNPAHVLNRGIPARVHIGRHWPAASDVHRWVLCNLAA